jgi:hypothetical protein
MVWCVICFFLGAVFGMFLAVIVAANRREDD